MRQIRGSPHWAGITLVRAKQGEVSEFGGHPYERSPDWGWAPLSDAGAIVVSVPGTHYTLLTEHIATVASVISG